MCNLCICCCNNQVSRPRFDASSYSSQFIYYLPQVRQLLARCSCCLPSLLLQKQWYLQFNIIVVMETEASQWDSFHVELAMECHAGKRILTSCRVTCWFQHAAAEDCRGHFNIVEGCNAFHVVTLHATSTSAPKALTQSLN